MGNVVFFAFTSALNPTLLTASTVMLLLDHPARLMLGYWLGAMLTSVTLGIIIVFAFQDSSTTNTAQHTVSPIVDLALGGLALAIAFAIRSGRAARFNERRAVKREGKEPPRWQQTLSKGTARTTFVIGALLTLPGASYLASLHALGKQDYADAVTVLCVIGINLIMLILIEAPLLAFRLAPEWTPRAIDGAKTWGREHGGAFAMWFLAAVGACLVLKGLIGLL